MEPVAGKRRIGIMGGTFNPIHMGHLILGENAYEQFGLDKVWFMPDRIPPHKKDVDILSDEHRKRFVELAIEGNPRFALSTIELEREGTTYSVDTLQELTNQNESDEYYFIIGADSLYQIETWKEPERLLHLAHFVATSRYNISKEKIEEQIALLNDKFKADIAYLEVPCIDISSKFLREQLRQNKSVKYYLPEKVYDYIKRNDLYR